LKKEFRKIRISTAKSLQNENKFFESIVNLIQQSRSTVVKYVNTAMVITYYEIGRRIIEQEQHGENRAQYGKKILQGLSDYLTAKLGKGWSIHNLKLMRQFYQVYSKAPIRQPPVSESNASIGEPTVSLFNPAISWKNYIHLMRINDTNERSFYERDRYGG